MKVNELILDMAVRYGFQVLGALVVLGAGVAAAAWAGSVVDRMARRQTLEPPMRMLMVRVTRLVVVLLAVLVALDKFGFQIAPLVAGIGVAGLGVGIALQGVLGNVLAGLTLIFTKPFVVGEYIEVTGVHGDVATIELFSTTLVHPDKSRVIVPNRKIVGEILHNFGSMRQLHLTLTVPHGTELPAALRTAREIVEHHPKVLEDPAPLVGIGEVSALGIRIGIRPWVRVPDVVTAEGELYQALIERFRVAHVGVPVPRHEVRLLDGAAVR